MSCLENLPTLELCVLRSAYSSGQISPRELFAALLEKADGYEDRNIWIKRFTMEELEPFLSALEGKSIEDLPLYGIPFAVKDNIDVAGITTTAGCPDFAYVPEKHAFLVQCLVDAGAIPLGKTNLDQFATGLVGTRSPEPWGPCRNAFDPEYISGGSSSGSAVAVSLGLVSFSLGTDTAGSGRVPAMLNNIYGLKPSRGLFSMTGVVPACRTLDCPSVFALSAEDAVAVFNSGAQYDQGDAYSRQNPYANQSRQFGLPSNGPKIGVPFSEQLEFFGDDSAGQLFLDSLGKWRSLDAEIIEMDFAPLFEAARLLYQGPWVAERYAAIEDLMKNNPEAVHPVVREVVGAAEGKSAVDAFNSEYQMQDYRKIADSMMGEVDFLLTPTAPTAYKVEELLERPVELNSNMGYYTNYMNLLDLSGIAVPAGFLDCGIPFGITLIGKAFEDQKLAGFAALWQRNMELPAGAGKVQPGAAKFPNANHSDRLDVAVCGAHLDGMPLNWQLRERGGKLKQTTTTSSKYRFYALAGGPPFRPGLVRDEAGAAIEVEVWSLPKTEFGDFVTNIPAPLGIGKVELADGTWVSGFICESYGLEGAEDITDKGAWRAYLGTSQAS